MITDDEAKLAKELVAAGRDFGGWGAEILDDLPKDIVGLLVGDRVKVARFERLARLMNDAKKRLEDRGVIEPEPPGLKHALPILAAAADENREELQDLWARLLAAAMDPNRQGVFRQAFISIVKEMDPLDALVFDEVVKAGGGPWVPTGRDAIAAKLNKSHDEVLVSFANLKKLGCIDFDLAGPEINPHLLPLGKLLANAIA